MDNDALTKYKAAADVVHKVMTKLVGLCVEGAKVLDLCVEGDKAIEEGTGSVFNKSVKGVKTNKGQAFPTCVSVNNVVSHFSPLASDPLSSATLNASDVVKIQLGAHIDGFAAVSAETLIVGATAESPATGRKADVVKAAWTAAEAAMRLVKAGEKNYTVTDVVAKAAAQWDCHPVEGMLSCQQSQGIIDGKKRIILNPTLEQRQGTEAVTFTEGEVWGIDILVSNASDGKARPEESRTTVFQKVSEVTYQLKMKNSRTIFTEIQKKAGAFPFTLRALEDEKRARMGITEAVQHGLLREHDVVYTPKGTEVAAFHFTLALLPGGPTLLTHPPVWYSADKLKTEKEVEDETLKELLAKKLRESKKKNKKKVEGGDAAEGKDEEVEAKSEEKETKEADKEE